MNKQEYAAYSNKLKESVTKMIAEIDALVLAESAATVDTGLDIVKEDKTASLYLYDSFICASEAFIMQATEIAAYIALEAEINDK